MVAIGGSRNGDWLRLIAQTTSISHATYQCVPANLTALRERPANRPYRSGRSPAWIKVKNPDAPQDTLDFICARLRSRIGTQFIYKFGERGHH
jgi:hypothetical protein